MMQELHADCWKCGSTVALDDGGLQCSSCTADISACDDCDEIVTDGSYHLCERCNSARN